MTQWRCTCLDTNTQAWHPMPHGCIACHLKAARRSLPLEVTSRKPRRWMAEFISRLWLLPISQVDISAPLSIVRKRKNSGIICSSGNLSAFQSNSGVCLLWGMNAGSEGCFASFRALQPITQLGRDSFWSIQRPKPSPPITQLFIGSASVAGFWAPVSHPCSMLCFWD